MAFFANIVTKKLGASSPQSPNSVSPYPSTPVPVKEKKFVIVCFGRVVHYSVADLRQAHALAGKLRRTFLLAERPRALFALADLVNMTVLTNSSVVDLDVNGAVPPAYAKRVYEELSDNATYTICPESTALRFHGNPVSPLYTAFMGSPDFAAFKTIVGQFYTWSDKDIEVFKTIPGKASVMIRDEEMFLRAVEERAEFVVAAVEGTETIPGANMAARNIFDWLFACIAAQMRVVRRTSSKFFNKVQYDLIEGKPFEKWKSYDKQERCSDLAIWIQTNPVYAARGASFWTDAYTWHRRASKTDAHVSALENIEEHLKDDNSMAAFKRFLPHQIKLDKSQQMLVKDAVSLLKNLVTNGIHPEVAVLAVDIANFPGEYQHYWIGEGNLASKIEENCWEICDLYRELLTGDLSIIRVSHGLEYNV